MSKQKLAPSNFEAEQKNNEFRFKRKQNYEKIMHDLNALFEKYENKTVSYYEVSNSSYFYEYFVEYLTFLMEHNSMYFTFGKYKGMLVDAVLQENKDYCKWFVYNVRGRDLKTLRILDYLNKKVNGRGEYETRYYFRSFETVWSVALKKLPEKWLEPVQSIKEEFSKNFGYTPPKYSSCSSYDIGSIGYEDNSCFSYWGDTVVDYGDLC